MDSNNQIPISDKLFTLANTSEIVSDDKARKQLIELINDLIKKDFPSLIQLLYRIDVNEKKLKDLLQQSPGTDAALIIADAIVKRQLQKIASREKFSPKNNAADKDQW